MGFLIPLAVTAAAGAGTAAAAGSSLATIGTIASIASAGVGAFGAIKQSEAASSAADYSSQIAANNAKIANQNAAFQGAEGEANAAAQEMRTRAKVGAITAAQGASGIDVNKGSAVDVREGTAELGQLDAMTIRSNAARAAYGFQTQSTGDTAQSQLDKSTAKNDTTAGYITGAGTLLSSAGSAALNYANFQNSKSAFGTDDLWQTQSPAPVSYEPDTQVG